MNYQIEPCHINKIIIYENVNYSPPPYLILKTSKQTLCLFRWKTFYKDSFLHFPMFGSIKKKIGQWKTIFSQWKTLIKIRLIFYKLFSKIFFLENNLSLTQCITLILLLTQKKIFSFVHSAFLTINSLTSSPPFIFSLFSHPHYHPL